MGCGSSNGEGGSSRSTGSDIVLYGTVAAQPDNLCPTAPAPCTYQGGTFYRYADDTYSLNGNIDGIYTQANFLDAKTLLPDYAVARMYLTPNGAYKSLFLVLKKADNTVYLVKDTNGNYKLDVTDTFLVQLTITMGSN